MPDTLVTRPERPSDAALIEALHRAAFGPGRYVRAAFRVREQAPHDPDLSFVTEKDGRPVASVRMTPIRVGESRGLLLGPRVDDPCCKNMGYGKSLLRLALDEAQKSGCAFVILVGDEPYYGPFGFKPLPRGAVRMPGPVDPARLLVAEFQPGAADGLSGIVVGIRAQE